MIKHFLIALLFVFQEILCFGQEQNIKVSLSLKNVLDLAVKQSSSVKYTQNNNVNYYWRWKNFQTTFRPQLTLSGDLPNYARAWTSVIQPDGSISFQKTDQLNASANLALSQAIPITGTYIYAASYLLRNQDYIKGSTNFSGSPFYFGFTQPLFGYNWMKWAKKNRASYIRRSTESVFAVNRGNIA